MRKIFLRSCLAVLVLFAFAAVAPSPARAAASQGKVANELRLMYRDAVEDYKQRRFQDAQGKFRQIEVISPNYEATRAFLKRLDQHLSFLGQEQARQKELKAKAVAASRENREKVFDVQQKELARSYRAEKLYKANLKERQQKIAVRQKEQARQNLLRAGDARYKNILALYKAGRYAETRDELQTLRVFLERALFPKNYRIKMNSRLDAVEKKNDRAENRERAAAKQRSLKEEKIAAREQQAGETGQSRPDSKAEKIQRKRLRQEEARQKALGAQADKIRGQLAALEAKKQRLVSRDPESARALSQPPIEGSAMAMPPSSQKTDASIRGVAKTAAPPVDAEPMSVEPSPAVKRLSPEEKARIRQERDILKKELLAAVDGLYEDGVVLYQSGDPHLAKKMLLEVDKLWPNYKLTRSYLEIIDRDLARQGRRSDPGDISVPFLQETAGQQKRGNNRHQFIREELDDFHSQE
ncbi:MAG: hypothetical protein Q8Q08_01385 [Candidatus Omnitrophota bacterium]|nr:hypothetical protein [Candidatus Omnitrophota bacterium]MDZ4243395.1 hypothetical protein [Candidatus Omnitrophota bacterium]